MLVHLTVPVLHWLRFLELLEVSILNIQAAKLYGGALWRALTAG